MAGSVPYLNFDMSAIVEFDSLGPKINPNGEIMRVFEAVVNELEHETRFADARLANNDVFENVLIA